MEDEKGVKLCGLWLTELVKAVREDALAAALKRVGRNREELISEGK